MNLDWFRGDFIKNMQGSYIKDKVKNIAYRGIQATNEINCLPMDFCKFPHAELMYGLYNETLKHTCPIPIPEYVVRNFVLEKVEEQIAAMLSSTALKPEIQALLSDNSLPLKKQEKLLKGMILTASDILWLNKYAQDLGYLLDVYHGERYPSRFDEKQLPAVINQMDGKIEYIGKTDMSEGEMMTLLDQRKAVHARIYHIDSYWHCFYCTYKGLAGLERGVMGSQPHYHYISDKSGITIENLVDRIKRCDMPSSQVHIVIQRSF